MEIEMRSPEAFQTKIQTVLKINWKKVSSEEISEK